MIEKLNLKNQADSVAGLGAAGGTVFVILLAAIILAIKKRKSNKD